MTENIKKSIIQMKSEIYTVTSYYYGEKTIKNLLEEYKKRQKKSRILLSKMEKGRDNVG